MAATVLHYAGGKFLEFGELVGCKRTACIDVVVAEFRKACVVGHIVDSEPPASEQGSYEWSNDTADIDKYVENLKACVPLVGIFGIIVHLTYYSLKISLEQTVTECYKKQGSTCERQQPTGVFRGGEDGDRKKRISRCHNHQTGHDGAFIILCSIRDETADKAQHVYQRVKYSIDNTACLIAQTELGAQKEQEYCVHDIIAEPLAHIAECGCNQSFRMSFEHKS